MAQFLIGVGEDKFTEALSRSLQICLTIYKYTFKSINFVYLLV